MYHHSSNTKAYNTNYPCNYTEVKYEVYIILVHIIAMIIFCHDDCVIIFEILTMA